MTFYARVERSTRRWWFYLMVVLIQLLPPFPLREITSSRDFNRLVVDILSHALVLSWESFYLVFKLLPLAILLLVRFFPRSGIIFSLFAAFHYFLLAFFQNAAFLPNRGFAVLTSNLVMITLVAFSFLGEVFTRKNIFSFGRMDWRKALITGMAIFAFLYPLDPVSFRPSFRPEYVLGNIAGLTFCMMTPFYLMVLLSIYPGVNLVTLRITGLVGAIIGGYNVSLNFVFDLPRLWWNGVLHLPLLLLSSYAFGLSLKRD